MIEKITVKNIVEFKRKSEKSRLTFINNLKKPKPEKEIADGGGGDYWVTSSSAIGNFFKGGDKDVIANKIKEVAVRKGKTKVTQTRDMFERNIGILNKFEEFDFSDFRPNTALSFLPKSTSILKIKDVNVYVKPTYAFSFKDKGVDKVGAVWFVVKLNGYALTEIALFTDAIHYYLKINYKKFKVAPEYCIALDLFSQRQVKLSQLLNDEISSELEALLKKINKLQ